MLKVLSLFSGIGAFEKAIENIGVEYDLVNFCEFDKYAVKSYCAIHNVDESKNLGDITKVDETKLPRGIDLCCYGFPCQDISLAGQQKGLFNEDGTLTRSGLFFDALRIIEATMPKIAIAENVKNLVGKKFNAQFQVVLASLEAAGYNNYWAVLNAKDFGVPQNRERVFIISIRKDIDTGIFEFPKSFPLETRLKDILEDAVDEKYYLSTTMISSFDRHKERNSAKGNGFGWNPTNGDVVANTLLASGAVRPSDNFIVEPTIKQIAQMYPNSGNPQAGRIYDADGISPTMDNMGSGGNKMPKVLVYDEQNQYIRKDGCVGTIMTDGSSPKKNSVIIETTLRIRKLTPKECFRLMGFDDESFHRAEAVNSNTQLYKQAGNSIVVDVLEELFCMMLDEDGNLYV